MIRAGTRQLLQGLSEGRKARSGLVRLPGDRASFVIVLLCVCVCIAYQALFIAADTPMSVDEGYMGGVAARLATRHFLPYVDAATQRGPMQYWLVTLAQSIFGGVFEWRGFRYLGIAASSVTVMICGALGWQLGRPFAGAVAAVIYTYALYFAFDMGAGIGVNGEHIANPIMLGGVLCAVAAHARSAEGRPFRVWYFVGGVLTGCAGLTKQSILVQVLPVALWLSTEATLDKKAALREKWAPVGLYVGGWAAALGAVLVLYAAVGHLGTFFYWFVTYNANVHMGPYRSVDFGQSVMRFLSDAPYAVFPILLGMAAGLPRSTARAYALLKGSQPTTELGLEIVVAMQSVLALLLALMQLRFWPHHFAAFVPWLGLLFGIQIDAGLRTTEFPRFAFTAAAVAFVVLFGGPLSSRFYTLARQRARGGWEGSRRDPICQAVQQYSSPNDAIFVWGFAGDLYVSCRRRPASRYTYSIAVAGVVPPFWSDPRPEHVAPHAVRDVVQDLETERPPVIVDVPIAGYSMTRIDELNGIIRRDYCQVSLFPGHGEQQVTIYARRDRGVCH